MISDRHIPPTFDGVRPVLVVEDELLIALAIESAFNDVNVGVEIAGGYSEALDWLSRDPVRYAGAIVDVGLPDGRGDLLADELISWQPRLPLVLCTGYDRRELRCRALEDGAVALVLKPFLPRQLVAGFRFAQSLLADMRRSSNC